MRKRIEKMNSYAREFVADNKAMIGKVSDETLIKTMALAMSLKHNQLYGVTHSNALEIYNLSNDDLLRLSVADRNLVMRNSTLTYPLFVYNVGGTPAVYAAALLSMVLWISSWVKPIAVIVIFITVFVSIFIFKVCLRKESSSLYGYVVTILLTCLTNVCYSFLLKLSLYLPSLGLTPTVCIMLQILLQLFYMGLLWNVLGTAIRDWEDLGFGKYQKAFEKLETKTQNLFKHKEAKNPFYGGSDSISTPQANWQFYDNLTGNRKRRRIY
jgi:hypothetical protein